MEILEHPKWDMLFAVSRSIISWHSPVFIWKISNTVCHLVQFQRKYDSYYHAQTAKKTHNQLDLLLQQLYWNDFLITVKFLDFALAFPIFSFSLILAAMIPILALIQIQLTKLIVYTGWFRSELKNFDNHLVKL